MTSGRASSGDAIVAMDVGGTHIKSAEVTTDATIGPVRRIPTGREHGPESVIEHILDLAESLCVEVRASGRRPAGIGIAVPGIVDETAGSAVYSANLGWRDVAITDIVHRRTGLPVTLRHDVRAGALAEARQGAARGAESAIFLPIGTGIGGAVIIGGEVQRGAHSRSGELGHVVVDPLGPSCACGAQGCVETYASAAAIERDYGDRVGRVGRGVADAAAVAVLMAGGDSRAAAVWARAVDALARGIITASALLDPAVVVIGGGLSRSGDLLLDPLRSEVDRQATFHRPPELALARFADESACLGVGLAAWETTHPVRT